jgi:hypothetical protein
VVTAEVEQMLKESVMEIEKKKNPQVSIRTLSGKQPNVNLHERTKFSYVSFHLVSLINFRLDKRSEPVQTPSLKPILFSPSKPKGKVSQQQNPTVKKGVMVQSKETSHSASRQTGDYGFVFILRCI